MATDLVLADTCAWIDFFNARPTPLATALERLLLHGEVFTCGIVQFELVQGVKSDREEKALLDAFRAVTHLEMTAPLWVKAGRLSGRLRRQGTTLPFSDILIASLAMEHDLTILTVDRHFQQISGVRTIG